jgi:hypothetical protein
MHIVCIYDSRDIDLHASTRLDPMCQIVIPH